MLDQLAKELNELFLAQDYSFESLLDKTKQSNLSLQQLKELLIKHQQDLNQTSLELFNSSYDRFYKLSYIISCLAEPIQHLIDPIKDFHEHLKQLCTDHDSYLELIDSKLSSLEETTKNQQLAERLIELIGRHLRIEERMQSIDWSLRPEQSSISSKESQRNNNSDIEFSVKCDLLERVNVELFYLSNEVQALLPTSDELIPIKKTLVANLDLRQQQLDNWSRSCFLEAIEVQDKNLIELIVRTYTQTEALHKLDTVWRQQVIRPYLNLTLAENHLDVDKVNHTFELLKQFLSRQIELVGVDFVAKSFWQEVVSSMMHLDRLFALDKLETFLSRYNATRDFLSYQKAHQPVETKANSLSDEQDHNTKMVLSRFHLKSYYNHRLAQIATSVESSLLKNPLSEIVTDNRPSSPTLRFKFNLKISADIHSFVTMCWSPDIYIDTLEISFGQLACRILNRFSDWLSKLRLSDFRIVGPISQEISRQTNFLAKQDALMRLLVEDCLLLKSLVNKFVSELPGSEPKLRSIREQLIEESLKVLESGLDNVRSLQHLIER